MPRRPDPATARLWQQRLQRFASAGLSVADFCDQEEISTASFYAWKRRLGPLTLPTEPATTDFVPVRLVPAAPALELLLPSGSVLRIGPDCDPALLRQVLALLGVAAC
jgi:transposase